MAFPSIFNKLSSSPPSLAAACLRSMWASNTPETFRVARSAGHRVVVTLPPPPLTRHPQLMHFS